MFRLPISGRTVTLRAPAGGEDLLLLDAAQLDVRLATDLCTRLATPAAEWEALPAGDFEVLLLQLRRIVFGNAVRADTICSAGKCGKRVDISFRISDYLAYHAPRRPRHIERTGDGDWLRLQGEEILFRLPTVQDQMEVCGLPDAADELARRCIRPAEVSGKALRRVERAMEALGPCLSRMLDGMCPECDGTTRVYFDVQQFVLAELREQAASLYREVHLLARHYHWSEQVILALPRHRRLRYAEMLLEERSVG